jgi:hypothetical protein
MINTYSLKQRDTMDTIYKWLQVLNAIRYEQSHPGYYSSAEVTNLFIKSEEYRTQFNEALPHNSTRHITVDDIPEYQDKINN